MDRSDKTCPAVSPESQARCSLPDTRWSHEAGHESEMVDNVSVSWATTVEDHKRWSDDG